MESPDVAPNELMWVKSSYSGTNGGDCVEVSLSPGTVHLRDSKSPGGPDLRLRNGAWFAFLAHVRRTDA
ncbi:DUF397 domain-containing protein [Streptomyces zingiberis]